MVGVHPERRCTAPASAAYRPGRPTGTPLYPVVLHHLETFLAEAQDADPMGWGVPSWVERNFRSCLRCGILAHGFPVGARTARTTGSWPFPARV
jgi:hypothetical protein